MMQREHRSLRKGFFSFQLRTGDRHTSNVTITTNQSLQLHRSHQHIVGGKSRITTGAFAVASRSLIGEVKESGIEVRNYLKLCDAVRQMVKACRGCQMSVDQVGNVTAIDNRGSLSHPQLDHSKQLDEDSPVVVEMPQPFFGMAYFKFASKSCH